MEHHLYLQVIQALNLRGLSKETEKSYTRHLNNLQKAFPSKPLQHLNLPDVLSYLSRFTKTHGYSVGYYNQCRAAFLFLFKNILRRKWNFSQLPFIKKEKRLPQVLNADEVKRVIQAAANPRNKAVISLLYSAGLRVREVCNLKISDIDSSRMLIHIRQSKGNKDRLVMLSPCLLTFLRDYYRSCLEKPKDFLFPGVIPGHPIARGTIHRFMRIIARKAGISKPVYPHILRHSFATHLLENGTNIRVIQVLLGHSFLSSTEIYTRVARNYIHQATSPLDALLTEPGDQQRSATCNAATTR